MKANRRRFLKGAAAMAMAGSLPVSLKASGTSTKDPPEYERPLFQLHRYLTTPVRVESIELLKQGTYYFVRSRSADGAVGIARTKQIEHYIPIFQHLVVPHFIGEDARDLETLIDQVYVKNYKIAGQPFWCPVAYVEQSLFDLLGKVAGKSVGELMGGVLRTEIPVYLSGSGRDTTAEEEVDVYVNGVQHTGARAVKLKIGGRMSRNADTYPGRTEQLLELSRKLLGDEVVLFADANGSYDARKAIEIGRVLEELNFGFFEEPCPWEELTETLAVTDALDIPVAAGEQDASLWRFNWMMENGVMDIVQPDLNYNGGFIRAARVARMARKHGMNIIPHNTQTGASAVNMLQFASAIPNVGAYMEFPWRRPSEPVSWYAPNFGIVDGVVTVPTGPGLGLEIDPAFLQKAVVVS